MFADQMFDLDINAVMKTLLNQLKHWENPNL